MKRYYYLFFLLVISSFQIIQGQESYFPEDRESPSKSSRDGATSNKTSLNRPIFLDEVEYLSVRANPSVRIQKHELNIARSQQDLAYSAFLPNISATAKYSYLDPPPGMEKQLYGFIPMKLDLGSKDNYSYGLEMTYVLFAGGKRFDGYEAAKLGREAQEWLLKDEIRNSLFEGRQAYFRVLVLKEMRLLARRNEGRTKEHLEKAEKRFKSGTISKIDLLRTRTDYAEASLMSQESDDIYHVGLDRLKLILGLSLEDNRYPADDLQKGGLILEKYFESGDTNVKNKKPEYTKLKVIELRSKQAKLGVDVVKKSFYPTVAAKITYDRTRPYRAANEYGDNYVFAVGATLPIYEGGSRWHELKIAKEKAKQADIVRDDVRKQLESYYSILNNRIKSLYRGMSVRRANIEKARTTRDAMQVAYENGAATRSELSDTELMLFRMEVEYLKQIGELFESLAERERIAGIPCRVFSLLRGESKETEKNGRSKP